nr:MAG TPA: hypothetical protein [Caudoviricetes sp.]
MLMGGGINTYGLLVYIIGYIRDTFYCKNNMSYIEAYYNIINTGMVVCKAYRVEITKDLSFHGKAPITNKNDIPMPSIINAKDLPYNSIYLAPTSEFIKDDNTILVLTPDNEIVKYTPQINS